MRTYSWSFREFMEAPEEYIAEAIRMINEQNDQDEMDALDRMAKGQG